MQAAHAAAASRASRNHERQYKRAERDVKRARSASGFQAVGIKPVAHPYAHGFNARKHTTL